MHLNLQIGLSKKTFHFELTSGPPQKLINLGNCMILQKNTITGSLSCNLTTLNYTGKILNFFISNSQ